MVARHDIINTAREYLGTPFHHAGRLKGKGIDCVGLCGCVAFELGLVSQQFDLLTYSRHPDGQTLQAQLSKCLDEIPVDSALIGDMLTFWIGKKTLVTHIAIISPIGMIHTHGGVGKVVEHNLDDKWRTRIAAAYKYRGVEDFYDSTRVSAFNTETRVESSNCIGCGD